MPTFEQLQQTHPKYDRLGWTKLDLMAKGGLELLEAIQDPESVGIPEGEELLVKRMGEGAVYEERKRRAFVLPNLPHILGFFSSSTLADPPAVKEKVEEPPAPSVPKAGAPDAESPPDDGAAEPSEPPEQGGGAEGGDEAEPKDPIAQVDEPTWYEKFQENVDRHGTDLPEFMRRRLIDALTLRSGYVFVDFPAMPEDSVIESVYDEEKAALLDGYLCPISRMQLLDWERDESGNFVWAKVLTMSRPLDDPLSPRTTRRYEWRIFRAAPTASAEGAPSDAPAGDGEASAEPSATVELYRLDWVSTEQNPVPPPDLPVPQMATTPMRYSGFPLVELEVPDGLWVAAKVFSAECELLNKRNAKSWSEYITAFKFLLHKAANENEPGPRRNFGDGSVKTIRIDEELDWRGAGHADIAELRETGRELTEEIHRVANALALAAPLGAIQQAASGEAKRRDNQPSTIVCRAFAAIVRDTIQECFDRLAEGRGEDLEFEVSGLRRFTDDQSILDLLVSGIDSKIRSDTAQVEIQKRALHELLPDISPELEAEIEAEFEKQATQRAARRDALTKVATENPEAFAGAGNGAPGAAPAADPSLR